MADQGIVDANTRTDAGINNNGGLPDDINLSHGDHGDTEKKNQISTTDDNDVKVCRKLLEGFDYDNFDALHQQDQMDRDDEEEESTVVGKKSVESERLEISESAFSRVFRELAQDYASEVRFETHAVRALHEAAEVFIAGIFHDARLVLKYDKSCILRPRHMGRGQELRRRSTRLKDEAAALEERVAREIERYENDL